MRDARKRKELHPFEERRIGWIAKLPNYRVLCLGQSAQDFCDGLRYLLPSSSDPPSHDPLLRCKRALLRAALEDHELESDRCLVSLSLSVHPSLSA